MTRGKKINTKPTLDSFIKIRQRPKTSGCSRYTADGYKKNRIFYSRKFCFVGSKKKCVLFRRKIALCEIQLNSSIDLGKRQRHNNFRLFHTSSSDPTDQRPKKKIDEMRRDAKIHAKFEKSNSLTTTLSGRDEFREKMEYK